MDLISEIKRAYNRIYHDTLNTPLLYSKWLSNVCSGKVYLKLESEQVTGSFKARGSLNKLRWIEEQKLDTLPVTASTGNHGLGFARACDLLGMKGKIFLPENAVTSKVEAIEEFDIEAGFYGDDPFQTEMYTREQAEQNNWIYVSPYNDLQVIAGQGTIAMEIMKVAKPDNVLATVGGGGLISGIGSYIKNESSQTTIIGCQPENSPEMSVSVQAGEYREVASQTTLSDGSAGGFETNSITFELCKRLVDDFILVSEDEIANAIRSMISHHSKLIEGAAGVAIASLLKEPGRFAGQTTVIIVCGANISIEKLKMIL